MLERRLAALLHQIFAARPVWNEAAIDGALLEKFLSDQDGEAFSALVARHGPMVLGVCHRILDHTEDAEDAFQATFLVLARRAGSIRRRTSLASWLYGVADHLARRVRLNRTRRRLCERQAMPTPTLQSEPAEGDLRRVIEEELARLPEKYRTPLLLCYYEGCSHEEMARQLCWRPGTVKSRLSRGRELLRGRLHRRGLTVGLVALIGATEAGQAAVHVPPALLAATTRAAVLVGAGNSLGGAAAPVALLVEGMMRTTLLQRTTTFLLALIGLCLAGGGWWAFHARAVSPPSTENRAKPTNPDGPPAPESDGPPNPPALVKAPYPRRMMAVVPVDYAFANPIAFGSDKSSLNSILHQFADLLRIPNDQLVILSDRAAQPKPPIKQMIEFNVSEFLKSCRPQDRVVLMFVGHAAEKDGKGYFLPLEGDKDDVATLIPLTWFYDQLKACPAQQKVFVVDVCRFDPIRDQERGKVEPMGAKFDEALLNPPDGVQVLTACTAGQYSYEIESNGNDDFGGFAGGVMLNQIPDIKFKGGLRGVIQKPEDALPIDALTRILGARTKTFAGAFLKKEQKVRLSGKGPTENAVPYDPKTALAPAFDIQLTDLFKQGVAKKEDVEKILRLANEIPPIKSNDGGAALNFESLPPYPAKALEGFKDDGELNPPLRILVRDAVSTLKDTAGSFQEQFDAPPANPQQESAFKDRILKINKDAAATQFKLSSVREELLDDSITAAREKESKYWRAAYDYTLSRLDARIAYISEYKIKLGEMSKEFPERDPNIHKGWRLVFRVHMDAVTEKDAKEAQKLLNQMAEDYKGTPWELIARRERLRRFGLEWRPTPK